MASSNGIEHFDNNKVNKDRKNRDKNRGKKYNEIDKNHPDNKFGIHRR